MKRIDSETVISWINSRVKSMLSKIEFVKIDYSPRYVYDSDKALFKDEDGYYELIYLDHGITQKEYMGVNILEVTNKIVKECIYFYAIGIYEPNRHKYNPSNAGTINWDLTNKFIAQCYECIYPNESPPVFPI